MVKSKAKKLEDCVTGLDIEVSPELVGKAFDEVYAEIGRVASVPGFRAGKVPQDLVRKHYAKNAHEETLKRLLPDAYQKAVAEHKLDPLGMPAISDVDFAEGKALVFKARVNTRPQFKLKEYKGLAAERKKSAVAPDDIEKTLENLRQMHAKYNSADERAVILGDFIVGDLEVTVDGKAAHKKRENIWLAAEKESFIPGLGEGMVGMKKDETKDIDVVLPEKYPDKNIAGKKAVCRVVVKSVKVRQLPNLDDEFAKDLGKETVAVLKEDIAKELGERMSASADVDVENKLLTKLIDEHTFAVPASFVKRQLDHMVANAKEKLVEKGFKKEDLDKKEEEFRGKFKEDAIRQVRLLFILDAIATAEGVTVTEEDIKKSYESIAAQAGRSADEVKAYYEKEEMVDSLAEKIREEKTIEIVKKSAVVTEKE